MRGQIGTCWRPSTSASASLSELPGAQNNISLTSARSRIPIRSPVQRPLVGSRNGRPRSSSPESVQFSNSGHSVIGSSSSLVGSPHMPAGGTRVLHSRWQPDPNGVSRSPRLAASARSPASESRAIYQSTSPVGRPQVGRQAKTFYADPQSLVVARTRYEMQPAHQQAYPRATTFYDVPPVDSAVQQPLATHYEDPRIALEVDILRASTPTTYGEPPTIEWIETHQNTFIPATEEASVTRTTYGYPPTYSPVHARAASGISSCSGSPVRQMPQVVEFPVTPTRDDSESALVQCQAVFVNKPVCWTFQVPSGTPVKQAVAKAEEEALQRSGTLFQESGKCVTMLPSVSREAMVGEWAHQNMDQPPLVILSGGEKEPDPSSGKQHQLEEQLVMMAVVQKQLNEQCAIIQNQESFITELQSRSRQNWQQLEDALHAIEDDVADIKGRIHALQDVETPVGKSFSEKKDARRRRQK